MGEEKREMTQDPKHSILDPSPLGLLTSMSSCSGGQGSHCGGWRCSRQPQAGWPLETVRAWGWGNTNSVEGWGAHREEATAGREQSDQPDVGQGPMGRREYVHFESPRTLKSCLCLLMEHMGFSCTGF